GLTTASRRRPKKHSTRASTAEFTSARPAATPNYRAFRLEALLWRTLRNPPRESALARSTTSIRKVKLAVMAKTAATISESWSTLACSDASVDIFGLLAHRTRLAIGHTVKAQT